MLSWCRSGTPMRKEPPLTPWRAGASCSGLSSPLWALGPGACCILGQMKSGTSSFSRSAQVREPVALVRRRPHLWDLSPPCSCRSLSLWNRSRLPKAVFNAWVTRFWSRKARATGRNPEKESSLRQGWSVDKSSSLTASPLRVPCEP